MLRFKGDKTSYIILFALDEDIVIWYYLVKKIQYMEKIYMGTTFKLNSVIDELNITPNKLATLSGVRTATVYLIYNNQMRRLHIDVLDSIIDALNKYSSDKGLNKTYSINDILDYKKTQK